MLDPSITETFETERFSSESTEELECDPGYYIDGISAKFKEQSQDYVDSNDPGSTPLDLLAMGTLYSTYDSSLWNSVKWSDPRIDGAFGFHSHIDTYYDFDSEFWINVAFPSDETLLVKKMEL